MKRHSMRMTRWVVFCIACALVISLSVAGAATAAPRSQPDPRPPAALSRGVIILPRTAGVAVAQLHAGDMPMLAGTPVHVEQTDPQAGLLVSSDSLGDAALAHALVAAGIDAEVNHLRYLLPITPTAALVG